MDIKAFTHSYDALPEGYFEGRYKDRRYGVRKKVSIDGKRGNLVAEELGGNDYISLNFYRLSGGVAKLKPCEMPIQKVVDFVLGVSVQA